MGTEYLLGWTFGLDYYGSFYIHFMVTGVEVTGV